MRTDLRSGQAMIELAIGMFVFALVLSALFTFAAIIPESIRAQNMVRKLAGRDALTGGGAREGALPAATAESLGGPAAAVPAVELAVQRLDFTIDIDAFAAENLFGDPSTAEIRMGEEARIPTMSVPAFDVGALSEGGDLL